MLRKIHDGYFCDRRYVCLTPPPGQTIKPGFSIPAIIRLAEAQLGLYKTFKPMGTILTSSPHFMVSCLFTKHILTCGYVTVDGEEKLCLPKRRASIAGHSIPSTFFCTSAVCLLIGQNVNAKTNKFHEMQFWSNRKEFFTYIWVNK